MDGKMFQKEKGEKMIDTKDIIGWANKPIDNCFGRDFLKERERRREHAL